MPRKGDEKCQRCGEYGKDRRTLKMACFYAMEELGIPLEREVLFHADIKSLKKKKDPAMTAKFIEAQKKKEGA